jgi:hypothetical protein
MTFSAAEVRFRSASVMPLVSARSTRSTMRAARR